MDHSKWILTHFNEMTRLTGYAPRRCDAMLTAGKADENGTIFVRYPVSRLAAALSRCEMTVKRSLNELEDAGLVMRVRRGQMYNTLSDKRNLMQY